MSDKRIIKRADGIVEPAPGYKWCPQCNGEGEIWRMDSSPNLDEHCEECSFCQGSGINER